MSRIKKRFILFIVNHFLCGTHAFGVKRALLNLIPGIHIGNDSKIVGPIFVFGSLSIGEATWIGHDFRAEGNGHVSIGSQCDVAPLVTCFTGGHKIGNHGRRAGAGITEEIIIKDGCWIGGQTVLLQGITVNDGAIIAAGAVVTKNVDADCLAGGVPAKTIRQL